jgi:hypothetical protein
MRPKKEFPKAAGTNIQGFPEVAGGHIYEENVQKIINNSGF